MARKLQIISYDDEDIPYFYRIVLKNIEVASIDCNNSRNV